MIRNASASIVWLCLAACSANGPKADQAGADAAVKAELAQREADYSTAIKAGDANTVATFMADDVHFLEPDLDLTGATQARALLADLFAHGLKVNDIKITPLDVFVHGDVAYEMGRWDEDLTKDGKAIHSSENYFMRWKKTADGQWRFDRFVSGPAGSPRSPQR